VSDVLDFGKYKRTALLPLPEALNQQSLQPTTLPVFKPLSSLSEQDVRLYNSLLEQAAQSASDREQQAACLAAALDICDQDEALHGKLAWIASRLW
jgi:hypothetical protein